MHLFTVLAELFEFLHLTGHKANNSCSYVADDIVICHAVFLGIFAVYSELLCIYRTLLAEILTVASDSFSSCGLCASVVCMWLFLSFCDTIIQYVPEM